MLGGQRYRGRAAVVAGHPVDGLTGPVSTGYGVVDAELTGRPMRLPDLTGLTLLAREGGRDRVEVLAGPVGQGLWLPHEWARQQGIRVGDGLRLSFRGSEPRVWDASPDGEPGAADPEPVTVPVAAIYQDLRASPDTAYWCGLADIYRGSEDPTADPPPPVALVDTATFLTVGQTTRMAGRQRIGLAVANPTLTAPEAATVATDIDRLQMTLVRDHPALFPTGSFTDDTEFTSYLDRYQRRGELVRTGLLPPVLPITAAGTLVGLAVAAAAAIFWVQRRRQELAVLATHGVSAGALGLKAVSEALPAVVAGAAAGWTTAWVLVAAVGPSPVLAPGTLPLAAVAAAATGLVGLGLTGRLATTGARGLTDTRPVSHRRPWWARVPWELALLAAAPAGWLLLADDQVADQTAGGVGTVAHVPARLLVVPILTIAGLAVFAARSATAGLRGHGVGPVPAGPGRLLAWRRLARHASATATLAAATAAPVAMATYGAAATDSIRTTAEAQLRFNLGSDAVVSYPRELDRDPAGPAPPPPPPESMAGRATQVLRLNQQNLGGLTVDVLAVDPETFTDGAYWDGRINTRSLSEATDQLTTGATPTVVASRRILPGPDTLTVGDEPIPVQVADTRPLPGAQAAYPLVIIDQEALRAVVSQQVLDTFQPQIWVAGDPERTEADFTAARLRPDRVVTVDDHRAGTLYEPVTYTFQYLIALSIFTGLIGAVALLLYLESRTTAHRRAYVMLRRLGLSPGAHRRAILLEVGAPVAAGLAAGLAGATVIAYTVRSGFDLAPRRFPDALLALPTEMAAVVAGAVFLIATAAGLLTHSRITRANPAEVLRDTT